MKLSNADIYNTKVPMQKLLAVKLPVLVGIGVVKLAQKLRGPLDVIEEVRSRLVAAYGEPDPHRPGASKISPEMEGFSKFAEELGTLLGQEVELEIDTVTIPASIEIEPFVVMALERFIQIE